MAAKHTEISVREFARRMGVSDTAVRNEIYDKKSKPSGCLRAGVVMRTAGSKTNPVIKFELAYEEWLKAGRTIKNPEYFPTNKGDAGGKSKEKIDALKQEIIDNTLKSGRDLNPIGGSETSMGFRSLLSDGMGKFEAEEVKAYYEAALKEIEYFKALGKLAPVDRVKFVLYEYGKTIKMSLLQIPARITDRVRASASDREGQDIMYKELEAVLYLLSQGPTQSMDENAKDEFDEDADKTYEHERSVIADE